MSYLKNKYLKVLIIPLIFFIVSLFTLKDYGINWDEPIHFIRGQAYLTYFLTGKTNYHEITSRPSYFQNTSLDAAYYLKSDSGHPPLNGILSAVSNLIFYQKLQILGDIDSYHLFNIVASTIMVIVVVFFSYQSFGFLASVMSGIVLSTYPLFFAESHFNIKDPPEAAFFAATIWLFWLSLKKFNWKWLILSALAFAFSFSMKFNILFIPFIIVPYLVIRYYGKFKVTISKIPLSYYLAIIASVVLVIVVFFGSWPYLWSDPLNNLLNIFLYYKGIGTGQPIFSGYEFIGLNMYPIYWIVVTTPPLTLILCLIGISGIFFLNKDKEKTTLLLLLWLIVPILRVSMPSASIYGGIRQIFEYIPAMSLLAGVGMKLMLDYSRYKHKFIIISIIPILLVTQVISIYNLHPNENVYFNFIAGGLNGAVNKQIPYWGNSYGNAYWQAVKWMNLNSEENATLGLVQGTGLNIPLVQLRPDIKFSNGYWTGIFRGGEYLMELTFNSGINPYPYAWEYVDKLLKPVYEVKVDGISIAKVWKNDIENTRDEYKKPEKKILNPKYTVTNNSINVFFDNNVVLTRFFLHYLSNKSCLKPQADVLTSVDGKKWFTEQDRIPVNHVNVDKLPINTAPFFFAGRTANYLKIVAPDKNSCLLKINYLEVWSL